MIRMAQSHFFQISHFLRSFRVDFEGTQTTQKGRKVKVLFSLNHHNQGGIGSPLLYSSLVEAVVSPDRNLGLD